MCLRQDTVVKYMTDGCLLREILADPHLSHYSVIILDEVHERSLDSVSPYNFSILQNIFFLRMRSIHVVTLICNGARAEKVDFLQDILLGLLKKNFSDPVQASAGRSFPLKVVVMSATMETEKLSDFLGDCRVFTIPGRSFPVTCTFGSAVGPKDTQSTAYIKEVLSLVQYV